MGRRWVVVAFLACAAGVAVLTFGPSPGHLLFSATQRAPGLDALSPRTVERVANVLLFVPLGFLLAGALPRLNGVLVWLLCTAASLGVETAQIWLPDRDASLRDVALNSLGAALGVVLFALVAAVTRSSGAAPRALSGSA
jgi:VanZ family protein